jgi:hypothetical protein
VIWVVADTCEGVTGNSEYNQVDENVPPVEFEPTKQGRVVIPAQMRRVVGWDDGGAENCWLMYR